MRVISTVIGNETSTSLYTTVKGVYDWVTSLFVKKGTITNNTILKGSGTDTATDSNITDDGTTVNVNSNTDITSNNSQSVLSVKDTFLNASFAGTGTYSEATLSETVAKISYEGVDNGKYEVTETSSKIAHSSLIELNAPLINAPQLTASTTLELDASKNLVSVAKGTAYNKNFGTGTTNVVEIGSTLGNSLIASTNASGKLETLPTATYPNLTELSYSKDVTSAIQTQLNGKRSTTSEMLLGTYGFPSLAPADATIYYFGEYDPTSSSTTQNVSKFQFPNNYTITKVLITLRCATNASNENVSFYLREAATTDKTITTSLDMNTIGANTNRVFLISGLSISLTSGTNYELKMLTPTWTTNPTSVVCSVKIFGY
jgi:hypothetical protein